jgi:hypothetical protein
MNIFLPYENDIEKSVMSLDDKGLNKQILECKQHVPKFFTKYVKDNWTTFGTFGGKN